MTKDYKIKLMQAKRLMVTFDGNLIQAKRMLKEKFGKEEYMSIYNDSKHILKTLRKYNKKLNRKQTKMLKDFAKYLYAHEDFSEYKKEDRPYLTQIIGPFYCSLYIFKWNGQAERTIDVNTIFNISGKSVTKDEWEAIYLLAQHQYSNPIIDHKRHDENSTSMIVPIVNINHVYDFKHILFGNGSYPPESFNVYAEYIDIDDSEQNGEKYDKNKWCEFIDFTDTESLEKGKIRAEEIKQEEEFKAILEAEYLTFSEMNAKYNGNVLAIAFSDKPIDRIMETYNIDKNFIRSLNTESKYKSFRKKILSENHPDKSGSDRDFLIAKANMKVLKQYLDKENIIKKKKIQAKKKKKIYRL